MGNLRLEIMLRKYHGIAPYNDDGNYVKGDGFFMNRILQEFSSAEIQKARMDLGIKQVEVR